MLDILRAYLVEAAPPEFVELIDDAHRIFVQMNLPHYEDGFVEILQMNDSIDAGDTVMLINNQTVGILDSLLMERGVTTSETCTLHMKTELMRGLMLLEHFENPQQILDIMYSDVSEVEKVAEALEVVIELDAEEILQSLDDVSPNCIGSLKDLLESQDANELDESEVIFRAQHVEMYTKFREFLAVKTLIMDELFTRGIDICLPFKVYLDVFGRNYEALSPDDAAANLIAMALASSDGMTNPMSAIKPHLESIIADPTQITRIDIRITDLLLRFNQYE
jgi:hypothetical protein